MTTKNEQIKILRDKLELANGEIRALDKAAAHRQERDLAQAKANTQAAVRKVVDEKLANIQKGLIPLEDLRAHFGELFISVDNEVEITYKFTGLRDEVSLAIEKALTKKSQKISFYHYDELRFRNVPFSYPSAFRIGNVL